MSASPFKDDLSGPIKEYIRHFGLYMQKPGTSALPSQIFSDFVATDTANLFDQLHREEYTRYCDSSAQGDAVFAVGSRGWEGGWRTEACVFSAILELLTAKYDKISATSYQQGWADFIGVVPSYSKNAVVKEVWPFAHALAVAWGILHKQITPIL